MAKKIKATINLSLTEAEFIKNVLGFELVKNEPKVEFRSEEARKIINEHLKTIPPENLVCSFIITLNSFKDIIKISLAVQQRVSLEYQFASTHKLDAPFEMIVPKYRCDI